jgi:alpha-beta hydrolase superfamily lysophospholipase
MDQVDDASAITRGRVALAVARMMRPVARVAGLVHGAPRQPDAFYDAPEVPPVGDGVLIRRATFTRAMPAGARAWRILYTTRRLDRSPALASALVVVPATMALRGVPVVAWAHGTTGIARHTAPSLLDDPFARGAMPAPAGVIERGWAIVATDYVGLGTQGNHRYLVGEESAYAVLDAVRAAEAAMDLDRLGPIVVWGHSQGGGAALWSGVVASGPGRHSSLPLAGIAALSPASDLPALATTLGDVPGGAIFAAYTISGIADAYDDVSLAAWVRPGCRRLVRLLAAHGIQGTDALVSVVGGLVAPSPLWARDPTTGALGRRLAENVPLGTIDVPVLIGQGGSDRLVTPAAQESYVAALREAGTDVYYRTYAGFDHVSVVRPGSPLIDELLTWTEDRFAGRPVTPFRTG